MATAARSGRPRIIGYAESGPPVRAPTSQGSSACDKSTKVEVTFEGSAYTFLYGIVTE
jgi:hypothetical protein